MEDIEYKLDNVKATPVAAGDIDKTFRSSTVGRHLRLSHAYIGCKEDILGPVFDKMPNKLTP